MGNAEYMGDSDKATQKAAMSVLQRIALIDESRAERMSARMSPTQRRHFDKMTGKKPVKKAKVSDPKSPRSSAKKRASIKKSKTPKKVADKKKKATKTKKNKSDKSSPDKASKEETKPTLVVKDDDSKSIETETETDSISDSNDQSQSQKESETESEIESDASTP